MRKLMGWTLASTTVVAMACGRSNRSTAVMSDDLKRDLKLASVTQNIQISPDEITPKSHQELAVRPKKAPNGPKVIRSQHPTVKASATPVQVAEIKTDVPQVQVMASAPAPSETPTPDSPPLARPSPVPAQSYPSAGTIPATGTAGHGGGIGGILGGIFGSIGGDDDHCDPRPGRQRGDIYGGRPRGPYGGGGMMGPIFRGGFP